MTILVMGQCRDGRITRPGQGLGLGDQLVTGVYYETCEQCAGAGCPGEPATVLEAARTAKGRSVEAERDDTATAD